MSDEKTEPSKLVDSLVTIIKEKTTIADLDNAQCFEEYDKCVARANGNGFEIRKCQNALERCMN